MRMPAVSSRYLAAAAITARAESFTLDGAWPSAQLMVLSAVAFEDATRDHFQNDMGGSLKLLRVPGAAQHEVMRCRPGIVTNSEIGTVPDQRCTASRRTASGTRRTSPRRHACE